MKAHSKNPSLLAGILVDEQGEPFVASHPTKQGRRYRHYISAGLVKHRRQRSAETSGNLAQPGWRLPAAEVEDAIINLLARLLEDRDWLLQQSRSPSSSIVGQQAILSRRQEFAQQLKGHELITQRGLILALIDRVIPSPEFVELKLKPAGRPGRIAGTLHGNVEISSSEMVTVRRAVSLRRRSIETRMIIEGQGALDPEPDPALIKALAQAHRWWSDLIQERYATMRELAQAYDTDERYVARIIDLAFLPADLTEAILERKQPIELTLHAFLKARDPDAMLNSSRKTHNIF